jgi:NAD-dependent deacetylase
MTKIVFTTGAGISVPSGIAPYRGTGGIYTKNPALEYAMTIDNWRKNPKVVNEHFQMVKAEFGNKHPNPAHIAIAQLQSHFDVTVITQNIDRLHQSAGSTNVLELHGNIFDTKIDDLERERPTAVLFGEDLPVGVFNDALLAVENADVIVAVGTSGTVYPAASLLDIANDRAYTEKIPFYYLSLDAPEMYLPFSRQILESADTSVPRLCEQFINSPK